MYTKDVVLLQDWKGECTPRTWNNRVSLGLDVLRGLVH